MDEQCVRYLGDGSQYIEGVPARDLTREEWERLRPDLRERALATGLYEDLRLRGDAAKESKPWLS